LYVAELHPLPPVLSLHTTVAVASSFVHAVSGVGGELDIVTVGAWVSILQLTGTSLKSVTPAVFWPALHIQDCVVTKAEPPRVYGAK
jgi:hypothetical protein